MATVTCFEELEIWKRARELVRDVYAVTRSGHFSKDFALRDQIRRAVISIPSNIAEGFERGGRQEFIQFLSIAKGSSGEVKAQLYIAFDQEYLSETAFAELKQQAAETANMIGGFMKYLAQSEVRGVKYKRDVARSAGAKRPTRNSKLETRNADPS
jgi:four helix bundle protein